MSEINTGGPAFPQPMLDTKGGSGIVVSEEMDFGGMTSQNRMWASTYCRETLGQVLGSIRTRYEKTGRMGCNAEELKVLRGFVGKYRDFWLKQPLALYEQACKALQEHYNRMMIERNAA